MQESTSNNDIMKRIEASNAGQELYAKKQYRMTQISAAANLLVLAIVIYLTATLIPKVNATFRDLSAVLENIETVSSELAQVDFNSMVTDIDDLVTDSSRDLKTAMDKINAIDIDTLNQAIKNLNDTVEPFANFFNRF